MRNVAAMDLSAASGSKAANADTAVRNTSMGWASRTSRITSYTGSGNCRASLSC